MPIGGETEFAFRGMRRADSLLEVGRGRVVIGCEARERDSKNAARFVDATDKEAVVGNCIHRPAPFWAVCAGFYAARDSHARTPPGAADGVQPFSPREP
jgi:hypothetical protein